MDLILLQPGDPSFFDGITPANGDRSRESQWPKGMVPPGKCIELVSVHQGMKQQMTTDVSSSARTTGRPAITEFTCVKYADKTSVKFYDYCLRAKPLGVGRLQPTLLYLLRQTDDKTANCMTFSLRDALISEVQFQSHPDDRPTEQFRLNFTEILWTYPVQEADGVLTGKVSAGWSLARNRPIGEFTD